MPSTDISVRKVPVLIVGAGPAGLTAALLLQSYGIEALTVTRHRWTANSPRAHHINPRAMEVLRELGLESHVTARAMAPDLVKNVTWCVSLAGEEIGRIPMYDRYEGLSPANPQNIPQHLLEPILAAELLSRGGELRFGTEFLCLEQEPDHVRVHLRDRMTGHEYRVDADYVIGADGANSEVARSIGLEFEGTVGWGAAVNVWMRADLTRFCAHRPGVLYWTNQPGNDFWIGSGVFVAVKPWSEWVVSLMYDPAAGELDKSVESLTARVRHIIGDPQVPIEIISASKWLMHAQYAPRLSKGRVYCVGDAVHRHSPANGLGANTSILDAHNLAWKLKLVLQHVAPAALLETYDQERQPIAQAVVERSMKSVREFAGVAAALGYSPGQSIADGQRQIDLLKDEGSAGRQRRAALDRALATQFYQFGAVGFELGYRYTAGALVPEPGGPESSSDPDLVYLPQTSPGSVLPHAWLTLGSQTLSTLDLTGQGEFHLLTGPGGEAWRQACTRIEREYGLFIRVSTIGPGGDYADPYRHWRAVRSVEDDGCVLVRPDHHVAWRARGASDAEVAALVEVVRLILQKFTVTVTP
jgi:2,4-dichlorophenol 6-monooxygenase